MSPLKKAALQLEMAEGRVQAITQRGGTLNSDIDEAVTDRNFTRSVFRELLAEAVDLDPSELARLLAL